MRKRILSWVMMFSMVFGLLPAVPVAAAQSSLEISNWPSGEDLKNDTLIVNINVDTSPSSAITVAKGKTVIVTGTGMIKGTSISDTIFTVENGGHLVLDDVTINGNTVGENGAVCVKKGGLLDLGYNDKGLRHAPGISSNTYNSAAKNLVIEEGATVRLNAEARKSIVDIFCIVIESVINQNIMTDLGSELEVKIMKRSLRSYVIFMVAGMIGLITENTDLIDSRSINDVSNIFSLTFLCFAAFYWFIYVQLMCQ